MQGSRVHLAALLLVLSTGRSEGDNKYCSLCNKLGSHTMCKFPSAGPGPRCRDYVPVPLTAEEEAEVLALHNKLRNNVALGRETLGAPGPQPPAANMRHLSWDNELAEIAQRWADQCISFNDPYQHDNCRVTDNYQVGQNVAASGYTVPEKTPLEDWVMNWFKEVKDFDKEWTDNFPGGSGNPSKPIGHYTQLVWANTYSVGCGRVSFSEELHGRKWTFWRLVCNYGPTGNYLADPVYKVGKACSNCPTGTKCSPVFEGLCSDGGELKEAPERKGPAGTNTTQYPSGAPPTQRWCHALLLAVLALVRGLALINY